MGRRKENTHWLFRRALLGPSSSTKLVSALAEAQLQITTLEASLVTEEEQRFALKAELLTQLESVQREAVNSTIWLQAERAKVVEMQQGLQEARSALAASETMLEMVERKLAVSGEHLEEVTGKLEAAQAEAAAMARALNGRTEELTMLEHHARTVEGRLTEKAVRRGMWEVFPYAISPTSHTHRRSSWLFTVCWMRQRQHEMHWWRSLRQLKSKIRSFSRLEVV